MAEPAKTEGEQKPKPAPAAARAGKPTGRRKWLFRLAAMILVPALVFGLLETGLRIGGYGYPTDFFLDGSQAERPGVVIDNPDFGRWVFPRMLNGTPRPIPFVLPIEKPPNTYRIFVVGESAAMGFPDPSSSFARALEVLLRARYPDRRFEVVNTSVVAINSHVVLPIARQCLQYQPDLLVVHLGNNEVVGPFGAAGVLGPYSPNLGLLRANLALKTTRTGQLLDALVHGFHSDAQSPRTWEGMSMFAKSHVRADDSRLADIRDHFRSNLQDICDAAAHAGVPVIVCTIPVNLKDCAPFGSLHAADLDAERTRLWDAAYQDGVKQEAEGKYADAVQRYEEADKTDNQYADLAFRLGRCYAALGNAAEARRQFVRARDLDTLRFRSDTAVNDTIRQVVAAREGQGIHLADAERAFDEASPSGIPGEELFLEHVHMNFHGNYLLARTVFQTLVGLGAKSPGASPGDSGPPLSETECAARLAVTPWSELSVATQVYEVLAWMPPFTGQLDRVERDRRWKAKLADLRGRLDPDGLKNIAAVFDKAVRANDADWMLRMNYGDLLSKMGDAKGAEEQYLACLKLLHHSYAAHCNLGLLLLREDRVDDAVSHFHDALRINPDCSDALYGMANALALQGKVDEGLKICEDRLDKEPNRATALGNLGLYLVHNGRTLEAIPRFEEVLRLDPDNVTALTQLGDAAERADKLDEALAHYEAALRIQPDLPGLSEHIARLRKGQDRE